ncbi:MAG: hypothetical protein WBD46_16805 [Acidobacteriaceae bacterium]
MAFKAPPKFGERSLTLNKVTHPRKNRDSQTTPQPNSHPSGPSWSLMLFIIFLAMLLATAIAWGFTHRFFQHS